MRRHSTKLAIGSALFLGAVLLIYMYTAGPWARPQVPEGIEADPTVVTMTNVDDNVGEDLIIASDKKVYDGFSGSQIYFTVDPLEKKSERVGLQFYFTDPRARVVRIYRYQTKDHYWRELQMSKGEIAGGQYPRAATRRKDLDGNAYIESNTSYDSTGEKQYFMAEIAYTAGVPGEFLIEGFGSEGSYGILDPWYSSGWAYRKKITINPQYVNGSSGQSNFPMLFSRTDAELKYTGSGGHVASSTGGEILFADEAGNKLSHEIEYYASTTGQLIAWVKVPFLSSTSTRDIYLYYGNATVPLANQQDKTNVWDTNYVGVYHLSESAANTTVNDSSSYNNGGTNAANTSGKTTAGQVDGAFTYNGSSDNTSLGTDADFSTTNFTLQAWVYWDGSSGDRAIVEHDRNGTNWYGLWKSGSGNSFHCRASGSSGHDFSGTVNPTRWYFVSCTLSGTTLDMYVDSALATEITGVTAPTSNTNSTYIGSNGSAGEYFASTLDEVRISKTARSAEWIATEYANQSSPNTFYSYEGEGVNIRASSVAGVTIRNGAGAATSWYNTSWPYRKKITINPQYVQGSSGQSNFPVLFSRTDADLKYTGSGGHVASSSAGEVVFTDGAGNKLAHEIEKYTSTTGELIAWVNVPFISSTSTRDIYLYYGNATVPLANQQNKTNVWDSNYKGVWHLPDGSSLTANDSTTNANDGTITGMTAGVGQIDGSAVGDGTNKYITLGTSNLPYGSASRTMCGWGKPAAVGGGYQWIAAYGSPSGGQSFFIGRNGTTLYVGGFGDDVTSNDYWGAGAWSYVCAVYDGSTASIYSNGKFLTSASKTWNTVQSLAYIGKQTTGSENWDGSIDEIRVSDVVRSAEWIATEYANQSAPNSFYSYSGEMVYTRSSATAGVLIRNGAGAANGWYNSSWPYRKVLTINPQYVKGSSGQSNFPMLFSRTDTELKATASGGHVASTTGGDILFTDAAGNKLAHEIEKYTSTTGELIAWVKVPFLSSTSTRDIYLYYGNATVPLANQQDKTGVWDSNYKLVWHMPDGTTLGALDSTSNGNDGTINSATAVAGKIDGGAGFNNQDITRNNSASTEVNSGDFTISTWFYQSAVDSYDALMDSQNAGSRDFCFEINSPTQQYVTVSGAGTVLSGSGWTRGVWHHFMWTRSGSSNTIYLDGQINSTFSFGNTTTYGGALSVGKHPSGGGGYWQGSQDEFRLLGTSRSGDWAVTEFNNQSAPNTFYSYSGEGVRTSTGSSVRGGVIFR